MTASSSFPSSGSHGLRGVDIAEERRAMARGLPTALVAWPTFAALDVFVVVAVFPGASIARLLLYRLLGEVILLWLYLLARREQTSPELLDAAHVFAVWSAGGLISVMALEFGDLTWNYMHGLSLVMLVDATILPTRFSRSLRMTLPVALSFPIIMGAGASLDPALAAQWSSQRSLVIFICNYIFVLATAILVSAASHGLWSARQQVFEARKLGRYRLVAPVGRGGQNEVWLAWDESLRRDVALKLLRSESKSEGDVRSFEREARATSRLTSPHTIRIFDFGASSDGVFYIAMEHLAGADLATLVRDHGPMPPARVVHFARQACLSLAEAHDAGVIHRDIKPHNLYITRVGDEHDVLKVLDFGIAKQVTLEGDASMTDVGVIKGTPTYMSPEMISAGNVDARSDIYSLGVTLYYLLTGVAPFDARSFGKLVYSHMTMPPIPPSLRTPWPLSSELEEVVMRCLAKKPSDRYQSARELLAALDAAAPTPAWTPEDAAKFWAARAVMPRGEPPPPDPGPTLRLRPDKAVSAA